MLRRAVPCHAGCAVPGCCSVACLPLVRQLPRPRRLADAASAPAHTSCFRAVPAVPPRQAAWRAARTTYCETSPKCLGSPWVRPWQARPFTVSGAVGGMGRTTWRLAGVLAGAGARRRPRLGRLGGPGRGWVLPAAVGRAADGGGRGGGERRCRSRTCTAAGVQAGGCCGGHAAGQFGGGSSAAAARRGPSSGCCAAAVGAGRRGVVALYAVTHCCGAGKLAADDWDER